MPRPVPLHTTHCGPCWAKFGGSPDAAEISAPPREALGSRDPVDQLEWPALLAAEPWVQQLRRDCQDKLLRAVREFTLRVHWKTWESAPGWDGLMDASGWARSTLGGWLRQLRLLGWLTIIEGGSTPEFRPASLAHIEGNRRTVYALRVPRRPDVQQPAQDGHQAAATARADVDTAEAHSERVTRAQAAWRAFAAGPVAASDQAKRRVGEETWTPSWSFGFLSWVGSWVSSRAREVFHTRQVSDTSEPEIEALRARIDENRRRTFADRSPASPAQMLAAAAELRREHPVLARLTFRAIRALCRPYWAAGWTNQDVLHALEYRPTSWSTLPAMDPAKVLSPYRWCQSRLSAWRTESGRVLPGHSRRTAQQRARRDAVMARHGRGGLAALPAGSARLCAADVRRHGQQRRDPARTQTLLRRHRAAEQADERATKTPAAQAAGPDTRQAVRDQLREQLLAQARAAAAAESATAQGGDVDQDHGQATANVPAAVWNPPGPGETPQDPYELARARARFEGRRRRPRR